MPTTVVVPSSCSRCSWARNAVSVPHWSWARSDADLAAVPAVGEQRARARGVPGAEQAGDVVGLHLGARGVLRVARRQLVGRRPACPSSASLVDPVRGRVQARAGRRAGRPTTSPRSRYAGRWPAGPASAPVDTQAADQSPGSSSPASTTSGSDHSPSPASVSTRTRTSRRSPERQRLARPRHQHVRIPLDAHGGAVVDLAPRRRAAGRTPRAAPTRAAAPARRCREGCRGVLHVPARVHPPDPDAGLEPASADTNDQRDRPGLSCAALQRGRVDAGQEASA